MQNRYIETKRLNIRPFTAQDLTDYFEILQEPTNFELAGQPIPDNLEMAERQLAQAIVQKTWAICLKSNGKVIGLVEQQVRFTGQPPVPDETQIQIGYLLNKKYRRLGYMQEALTAIFVYFEQQGLTDIWAGVFLNNTPSRRLLEKLNFSYQYKVDLGPMVQPFQREEAYYKLKIKN
ncbi:GNAT family N-acetyltransferase [Agrilactobacillus yilanensis]|uniref:GNAT family N-acetyltransferase n=1 Tax=Agrilactobacillus yilanensis TaxID=2485997 RepID=A0ABW4J7C8_9LACO|nr:GNAT family N-acetyltransferase [Agrilactobacillus yilanensis]